MITGLEFSNNEIVAQEKKYIDDFYKGDTTILSDGIRYYGVLFSSFLNNHADSNYEKLKQSAKEEILDKVFSRFQTAMKYAFNKGHQTCFLVLLLGSSQEFTKDFFKKPDALDFFIYTYDDMIKPDIFRENLTRDAIDKLIEYTRKNFENGYPEIMQIATRFFKKGISVAFEQIRKNIVKQDYEITGRSRMLNVPYNSDFSATPAFKATFSLESPAYEEWDLHWDATYGFEASKGLVAKTMVHQFRAKEIADYSEVDAKTYKMMKTFFTQDYEDDELLYMIRIDFLDTTRQEFPRIIQKSEYLAIRKALAETICRRLGVDGSHIFVSD